MKISLKINGVNGNRIVDSELIKSIDHRKVKKVFNRYNIKNKVITKKNKVTLITIDNYYDFYDMAYELGIDK